MKEENKDYGYGRCSTNEEKQDVEYQIKELMEKGILRENIYIEYESGAKEDIPEFELTSIVDLIDGFWLFIVRVVNLVKLFNTDISDILL